MGCTGGKCGGGRSSDVYVPHRRLPPPPSPPADDVSSVRNTTAIPAPATATTADVEPRSQRTSLLLPSATSDERQATTPKAGKAAVGGSGSSSSCSSSAPESFVEEFHMFDMDGDGMISRTDLVDFLECLAARQQSFQPRETSEAWSLEAYLRWRLALTRDGRFSRDVSCALLQADADFDGRVTLEDLVAFTVDWCPRPPADDLREMMRHVGVRLVSGVECVSAEAFERLMGGLERQSCSEAGSGGGGELSFPRPPSMKLSVQQAAKQGRRWSAGNLEGAGDRVGNSTSGSSSSSSSKNAQQIWCRWRCYNLVVMRGLLT